MSDSLNKTSDSLIRSFLVSDLSNLLTSLTKNEGMSRSLIFLNKKTYKNILKNKILDYLANIFERITHLLIYHERFAHGCSFVLSDLSYSLTVAHLS